LREGERTCPLKEIYTQDGKNPNTIEPTEVIVGVELPSPEKGSGASYQKLRLRGAIDFPLLGVAVWVAMDGDTCREARIVLGAVSSGPVQVTEAENLLQGATLTEEVIAEVGEIARKVSHPVASGRIYQESATRSGRQGRITIEKRERKRDEKAAYCAKSKWRRA